MVLAMALIITSMLPGFVTASADNSFYDFKLHFVGGRTAMKMLALQQSGRAIFGRVMVSATTPDKKNDVIIDVKSISEGS